MTAAARLGLLAALAALGACAAPLQQPAPQPQPAAESCDATKAQFAIGQESTMALHELARQRAGARVVRTLRPGQAVTMEYSAGRLTLSLDASSRVVRVTCG